MFVSKAKYAKLQEQYDQLALSHVDLIGRYNSLLTKSEALASRYIHLRNSLISHFGNGLFTDIKQDEIVKDGNVITVNRWKK